MARRLQHLAILLVLAGVATMVVPTMGFSNVVADRGVSVDVASDPNANLGIVDRSANTQLKKSGSATIYGLNDNANAFDLNDLSASVVRATKKNGGTVSDPGLTARVVSGSADDYDVEVVCDNDGGTTLSGQYTVTVDFAATGGIVVDATRTTNSTVKMSCKGGGPPVTVPSGGTENGNIDTSRDVVVGENGRVNGHVDSGGTVDVREGGRVNRYVTADESISLGENARVNGDVTSGGDVTLSEGARANQGVTADGNVSLGESARINQQVSAGGDVTLSEGSRVNQGVDSGGDVTLAEGARVNQAVEAGGSVTIGEGARINQDVTAGGDVVLQEGARVNGDVVTDGTVYLGCNTRVNGNIDAASIVDTC